MYALTANILANVANREANYGDRESNIKTEKTRIIVFILVCWQNNTCLAWWGRLNVYNRRVPKSRCRQTDSTHQEPDTCVSVVASLGKEFASRFAGVRALAADFKLFTAPFDFPVDDAPALPQMELVELQWNDEPKAKFYNSSLLSFFCDTALPSRNFPKYIAHVQRIVAMFGGTYCCEQPFSIMKYTKSRLRSLLSDRHLNDCPAHSSSRALTYFFMADRTSRLSDLPALQ